MNKYKNMVYTSYPALEKEEILAPVATLKNPQVIMLVRDKPRQKDKNSAVPLV